MMTLLRSVIARDLLLTYRRRADALTPLFFFVIVVSLFPLGVGPEPEMLRSIAPGVVWVAALLSAMLSLSSLFALDYADGTLEQMQLSGQPMALIVFAKVIAHWLASGLPLVLIAPVLGLQFGLHADAVLALLGSLLLGTPVLSLLGAVGAALTVGLRSSGVLLSLLVLPLCIPVLIFGAGAVDAIVNRMDAAGHFSLLGAMFVLALVFAPFAASAALYISME